VPVVEVNGLRIHAQELGAGPPAVLLHGIAVSNLSLWYLGAAPALARRRRVVLYDLRGHGLSETSANGYSSDVLARDLEGVLDRLCSEPADLVGFSFGGVVALRFCLELPQRVRRLVLVEMPLPPIDPAWLESLLDPAAAERRLVPLPLQQALARGGRQAVRHAERLRVISEETTLTGDVESERPFTAAELSKLDLPVLLCYGTETACPGAADWLREALPDAQVRVLEGGHYLPLDAPEALGTAISDFLDA
jgi:pimeloyl-ACP methyl ester carboxylesterase